MDAQVGQKVGPGKEIMAVYARISVMEKLRPQISIARSSIGLKVKGGRFYG